jgi:hypothetical protein
MVGVKVRDENRIDTSGDPWFDWWRDANERSDPRAQNRVGEDASASQFEQHAGMTEPRHRGRTVVHLALKVGHQLIRSAGWGIGNSKTCIFSRFG